MVANLHRNEISVQIKYFWYLMLTDADMWYVGNNMCFNKF